ncbi:RNA polymerase sigma factor [Aureimonas endophytica]|uniref:RNA polymerase sigma factor n=1 Tax=Aureimonas endophytica TaxID=2027858 RepID=A0A917E6U4_9HYPH|nr:sigma-70 family RNA polymerase sigma factor [Aureimonas endophytica]GGE09037.1 RNA polymerase sigma factor [Aureimonas endophytica]
MGDVLDEIADCVPALRRYARALTHDRESADDLVQDCLERAIRKKGLWRPIGPLRPWLFRILLNLHRNGLRQKRRAPPAVALDEIGTEPAVAAGQPGRVALAEMARAMERLPPDQREALLLVAVEGLAYAEAAAVLGIPIGTLMSRIGRARALLRQWTEDSGPKLRAVK